MAQLTFNIVNADVHSVHLPGGTHVGNLKRVELVWKFKAIGYDAQGAVEPGGGPFTHKHHTAFVSADAADVSARLNT
jgi:hypothetical protein